MLTLADQIVREELLPQDLDPLGLLADRIVQPALLIALLLLRAVSGVLKAPKDEAVQVGGGERDASSGLGQEMLAGFVPDRAKSAARLQHGDEFVDGGLKFGVDGA